MHETKVILKTIHKFLTFVVLISRLWNTHLWVRTWPKSLWTNLPPIWLSRNKMNVCNSESTSSIASHSHGYTLKVWRQSQGVTEKCREGRYWTKTGREQCRLPLTLVWNRRPLASRQSLESPSECHSLLQPRGFLPVTKGNNQILWK